jgi:thiol:disulfide interchange protein DsbD
MTPWFRFRDKLSASQPGDLTVMMSMKDRRAKQRTGAALWAALVLAAGGAWTQSVQVPKEPVKWSVKADPAGKPLKPGDSFTVEVTAAIEDGWHVYSLRQEEGGPIPTRINVPAGQAFEQAGEIESPEPKSEMDHNFNMTTQYYEGEAVFRVPVKVSSNVPSGKAAVRVNVSFQTCSGQLCLPPKTVKLAAEVNIASAR